MLESISRLKGKKQNIGLCHIRFLAQGLAERKRGLRKYQNIALSPQENKSFRAKTIQERQHLVEKQINLEITALFHSQINWRVKKRGHFKPNLFLDQKESFLYCLSSSSVQYVLCMQVLFSKLATMFSFALVSWGMTYALPQY